MPLFPERRVPARRIDVADLLRYDKSQSKLPSKDELDAGPKAQSMPEQKRAAAEPPKALPKGKAPEPAEAPGKKFQPPGLPSLKDILQDPIGAASWGAEAFKGGTPPPGEQRPQLRFEDPSMNERELSYGTVPGQGPKRYLPPRPRGSNVPPPELPPVPPPAAPGTGWGPFFKGALGGTALTYLAGQMGGVASLPAGIFNAVVSGLKSYGSYAVPNKGTPQLIGKPRAQLNYSPFPSGPSSGPPRGYEGARKSPSEPESAKKDPSKVPGISKSGLADTTVVLPDGMRHELQYHPDKYYYLQNRLNTLRQKAEALKAQGRDPREMSDYDTLEALESSPSLLVTDPVTGRNVNVLELSKP
jgi:hypothetical protein